MSWNPAQQVLPDRSARYAGDKFQKHGKEMTVEAGLAPNPLPSDTELVPETQLPKTPSIELSSSDDSSSSSSTKSLNGDGDEDEGDGTDSQTGEPRWPGRATQPSRNKASQLSQEAKAAKSKAERRAERQR